MKKHLLQAAERGDAEAQFNLGIMYENGLDDSRYAAEGNRPEAVRWLLPNRACPARKSNSQRCMPASPKCLIARSERAGGSCWQPQACAVPISKALNPLTNGRARV